MNTTTGEIKSQTVFMGDFPLMTERGTFVINGTERVVVSQLVRSPGVYFERTPDKTSDKDIYTAKVIPSRGAWLEFEIDKRDMVGVRVDRKRKQSVTVLLKALGMTEADILEEFGDFESMRLTLEKDHTAGQDDALLDIYRKLRPGEPPTREAAADPAGQPLLQPASATTWPRSAATRSTRSSASTAELSASVAVRRRHRRDDQVHRRRCTPASRPCRQRTATSRRAASRSTTSTTSATVACATSASSSRTRSAPACPAWSASSASA